jgi:class 3 adenylate cyclase
MARGSRRRRKGGKSPPPEQRLLETVRQTDSQPELVATAKFLRGLLPGSGDESRPPAGAGKVSRRLGRMVNELEPERPSAVRELGLGALGAWKALSQAQRRRQGDTDVAILFTDLVGFSSWALDAGDEAAVELLGQVEDAEEKAVRANGGVTVKRLGDGSMAVFNQAEEAIAAGLDAQSAVREIKTGGYRATLRAGVHLGRPRKVGGDFLGVDVNIAARVADAAEGNEVLVSDAAMEAAEGFRFGRERRLGAAGAPEDLGVRPVKSRTRRRGKRGQPR